MDRPAIGEQIVRVGVKGHHGDGNCRRERMDRLPQLVVDRFRAGAGNDGRSRSLRLSGNACRNHPPGDCGAIRLANDEEAIDSKVNFAGCRTSAPGE